MATAISKMNCGVMEAAKSSRLLWFQRRNCKAVASAFVTSIGTCSTDDMTDECITDMLPSNHDEHLDSLLHDKDFCLAARQYVRKHACRKGAPNLTSQMFAKWVETEYNIKITARKWLTKLGFSQIQHQKGAYFDGHDRDDVVAYIQESKIDDLDI